MRTCIFAVIPGLLAWLGSSPAAPAEREVFRYGNGASAGALIHDYSTRWVEFVGSEERYLFEETGRSDETIELIDRSRDVGLRVHAQQGELRLPRATAWQPWQEGKWVGKDEIPKSIRFVPTDQKIRLAYFVPRDRTPIAGYEQKIRVVMAVVDEVYSVLQTSGYRSARLSYQTNSKNEPIVHMIRGKKPAAYYTMPRHPARNWATRGSDVPVRPGESAVSSWIALFA